MSKFKLKDRIVCVSNGNLATVVGVDISPIISVIEYTVLWDHLPHKTHTYFEHEILTEWGKYQPSGLTVGYNSQGFISSIDTLSVDDVEFEKQLKGDFSCHHNMLDYTGFKESYKFCTKCDHKEYRND
jgi:hypothetical protein